MNRGEWIAASGEPDWEAVSAEAYQAYGRAVGLRSFRGGPMPGFAELPSATRLAWKEAAIAAALAAHGLYSNRAAAPDPGIASPMILLADLVDAMRRWGQDEDGIPAEASGAYERARRACEEYLAGPTGPG